MIDTPRQLYPLVANCYGLLKRLNNFIAISEIARLVCHLVAVVIRLFGSLGQAGRQTLRGDDVDRLQW